MHGIDVSYSRRNGGGRVNEYCLSIYIFLGVEKYNNKPERGWDAVTRAGVSAAKYSQWDRHPSYNIKRTLV